MIDEHTSDNLLVRSGRRWPIAKVMGAPANVIVMKGVPEHIQSDNTPSSWLEIFASGWRRRSQNVVHRTWKSVEERLLQIV